MLYREIIAVCSQIRTEHINALCGQNIEFVSVKPGGTYSDHWTLNGWTPKRNQSPQILPRFFFFVHRATLVMQQEKASLVLHVKANRAWDHNINGIAECIWECICWLFGRMSAVTRSYLGEIAKEKLMLPGGIALGLVDVMAFQLCIKLAHVMMLSNLILEVFGSKPGQHNLRHIL